MNLWLVSNIRIDPGRGLRASAIQNLRTAIAIAEAGNRVLLWVDRLPPGSIEWIEEQLGQSLPGALTLMQATARGAAGHKRSAFSTGRVRLWNIARGRFETGVPDAVMTRSPSVVLQLHQSRLLPPTTAVILELQYPEWSFLFRDWAKRNSGEGRGAAIRAFRSLFRHETEGYVAADGILYAARAHERLLDRAGFTGPRAWIPSGAPAPAPDVRPEDMVYELGYVGSLSPENGLEPLLEAIARVPGVRLGILGGGSARYIRSLEDLVGKLGIGERVDFAGRASPAEVRQWMRTCGAGVVPISRRHGSEKRNYASPLKLIEWMAAGVPVLASGVRSVVQHQENGGPAFLFEPDNVDSLVQSIETTLNDPIKAHAHAARGLQAARLRTFEARAKIVLDFIASLEKVPVHVHVSK